MENFILDIITPKGRYISDEVESVVFPGFRGEVGVLPNHADYIGLISTGLLTYRSKTAPTDAHLIVSGGIAQFHSGNKLSILADSVEVPTGDISFVQTQLSEIRSSTEDDENLSIDEKVSKLLEAYTEVEEKFINTSKKR
jgi:F-type H+-transporting ATPase subunit epsilon